MVPAVWQMGLSGCWWWWWIRVCGCMQVSCWFRHSFWLLCAWGQLTVKVIFTTNDTVISGQGEERVRDRTVFCTCVFFLCVSTFFKILCQCNFERYIFRCETLSSEGGDVGFPSLQKQFGYSAVVAVKILKVKVWKSEIWQRTCLFPQIKFLKCVLAHYWRFRVVICCTVKSPQTQSGVSHTADRVSAGINQV